VTPLATRSADVPYTITSRATVYRTPRRVRSVSAQRGSDEGPGLRAADLGVAGEQVLQRRWLVPPEGAEKLEPLHSRMRSAVPRAPKAAPGEVRTLPSQKNSSNTLAECSVVDDGDTHCAAAAWSDARACHVCLCH
jgi:hypothetical protein